MSVYRQVLVVGLPCGICADVARLRAIPLVIIDLPLGDGVGTSRCARCSVSLCLVHAHGALTRCLRCESGAPRSH